MFWEDRISKELHMFNLKNRIKGQRRKASIMIILPKNFKKILKKCMRWGRKLENKRWNMLKRFKEQRKIEEKKEHWIPRTNLNLGDSDLTIECKMKMVRINKPQRKRMKSILKISNSRILWLKWLMKISIFLRMKNSLMTNKKLIPMRKWKERFLMMMPMLSLNLWLIWRKEEKI